MKRIFSMVNHKGGVGKTTCAVNIAYQLSQLNHKVLLIDADPQWNATAGLGIEPDQVSGTLYNLFSDDPKDMDVSIQDIILPTKYNNLNLIPATIGMAIIDRIGFTGSELVIKNAINTVANDYDYTIIDTPPSLGILTTASMVASTHLLVPIQCEFYAVMGMAELIQTYRLVKRKLNPDIVVGGAIITMYDKRNNLSIETVNTVRNFFKEKTYNTLIPRTVRVSEAQ